MTEQTHPQPPTPPDDALPEIRYCCGFLIDDQLNVLLVRKNRPRWQAGRWNGVGGKANHGEALLAAMVREFAEETGLRTHAADWRLFALLQGDNGYERFRVEFFVARGSHAGHRSLTDERIAPWPAGALPKDTVGDIAHLVRLALAGPPSVVRFDRL